MFESLKWWSSFRRNANFWDWVRNTYSDEELVALTTEATDCDLIGPYIPFGHQTLAQFGFGEDLQRKTVRWLIRRYGDEIWSCCFGAGGWDDDNGRVGVICLAKLPLAFQVSNQATFEEFLVRNALKHAAQQIVEEGRKKR